MTTQLTRRKVLLGALAGLSVPVLYGLSRMDAFNPSTTWLSASGSDADRFALSFANDHGNHGSANSAFRGHGLSSNPAQPNQIVMVSRRPGNQGMVLNMANAQQTTAEPQFFQSPKHLFMEGHACFSADGAFLYCSETDRRTQKGVITVRETQTFSVIQELPSGGVGPHEILVIPNTQKLAIANGGLIKDEQGQLVNGQTMNSNVSILNLVTGKIEQQYKVPESKASLRHLDVSSDGIIAVGIQVQRDFMASTDLTPLAALILPGQGLIQLTAPASILLKLKDYMGSVRINDKYRTAAFTSPRGDLALFWNIDSGEFLGHHFFDNVCGLTVSQDSEFFILSNSAGKVRQLHGLTLKENISTRQSFPNLQWDNHMITLCS